MLSVLDSVDTVPQQSWLSVRNFIVDFRVVLSFGLFVGLVSAHIFEGVPSHLWSRDGDMIGRSGALLVVLGLAVRSWAAGVLFKGKTLATRGPFSMCRHPLYLGSFLMVIGFCLIFGNWLHLAVVVGVLTFIYRITIMNEERKLRDFYHAAWTDYERATPRFLPTRANYRPAPWRLSLWLRNREYKAMLSALAGLAMLEILHQLGMV